MTTITDNSFFQYYNTLQQAQQLLNDVENQYGFLLSKTSYVNSGSFTQGQKISRYEEELDNLMSLLISNQGFDPDDFRQKVDKVFVSILSTSDAYSNLLEVLLEVQKKLEEEMKHHLNKRKDQKDNEAIQEQAQKAKADLEKVMSMIQQLKENENHEIKLDLSEVQNHLINLRERYNLDVNPNQNLNKPKFNKVV